MSFHDPKPKLKPAKTIILNDPEQRNDRIGSRHHLLLTRIKPEDLGESERTKREKEQISTMRFLGYATEEANLTRQERESRARDIDLWVRFREKTDLGCGAVSWYMRNKRAWDDDEEIVDEVEERRIRAYQKFDRRQERAEVPDAVAKQYRIVKQRRQEKERKIKKAKRFDMDVHLTPGEKNLVKQTFEKHGKEEAIRLGRGRKIDDTLKRLNAGAPAPVPVSSVHEARAPRVDDVDGWKKREEQARKQNQGLFRIMEENEGDVWQKPGEDVEYY